MSGGRGFGVIILFGALAMSGACSDSEEGGQGTGAAGGSSGSAGSSGASGGAGSSGAGGSSGIGGSAEGGPLSDVFDRMAAAYCEAIFSCAELRKDFIMELLGGKERCPAVVKRILQSDPGNRERSRQLTQGTLTLNDTALEACLAHQKSCLLAERDIFQPCREAFEGSVQMGGSCRFDDECAGDAYCAIGTSCPGSCTPRRPAGGACGANGECAGRYSRCISSATGSGVCQELTVVEGVATGAPCGDTGTSELSACRAELWCDDRGTGQPACREMLAPGAACDSDFQVCAAGHFCDRDMPPGSCQPVTVARVGEPCDNANLTVCDIYEGSFCVAGRCEDTGDGGVGTRCGADTFSCALGLFCDRTNDTCQPEHATGEPCTSRLGCSSGTCGSDSRCAAAYCNL